MEALRFQLMQRHWYGESVDILVDGKAVGECEIAGSVRERGFFTLDGVRYEVEREGLFSGPYVLRVNGERIGHAERTGFFGSRTRVLYRHTLYELAVEEWFSSRCLVMKNGDMQVGSVARSGFFKLRWTVEFSDSTELPCAMFVFWMRLLQRKRDNQSAA